MSSGREAGGQRGTSDTAISGSIRSLSALEDIVLGTDGRWHGAVQGVLQVQSARPSSGALGNLLETFSGHMAD